MHVEYPKHLYPAGVAGADFVVVNDGAEEQAAAARGYARMWKLGDKIVGPAPTPAEQPAAPRGKPGRKPAADDLV